MNARSASVLLVEDNPDDALRDLLRAAPAGFDLRHVDRLALALDALRGHAFEAVLLALDLPDSRGLETLARVRGAAPRVPIVVSVGPADEEMAVRTMGLGAQEYVVKGRFTADLLVRILEYAIERKRGELDLRESEERYRNLFENSLEGIFQSTPGGRYVVVNPAFARMLGYESPDALVAAVHDIRGQLYVDRAYRDEVVRRLAAEGLVRDYETELRRKDGTTVTVRGTVRAVRDDAGRVASYEGIVQDVTERNRLEAQRARSRKMEAVGQLAGGIAHDFNNMLGVITGYTELLLRDLPEGSRQNKRGQEIQRAAERAAALTRQLLAFSRRQVMQPRVLDLNEIVPEVEKMLHRVIGENVQVVTSLGPALGKVRADPGQIEQVLMNLAINARDAMPGGGRLAIETSNVDLDEAYVRFNSGARTGPHVMLTVSDTGYGMDSATLARIFEPFFTTKSEGQGTGLGLATVYGTVRQSEGTVTVHSEPGKGTTFRIYLPRVTSPSAADAAARRAAPPGGSETILIVEDADPLRVLVRELLENAGYTVLEASGPQEALAAAARTGPIHLLLTDVVMPQMNGREMALQISALKPGVRVVFMSGYTDEVVGHHGLLEKPTAYLQKPFTMDALLAKIRAALDPGPAGC